jgi:hypothetical protein
MAGKSFSASVDKWVLATKARSEAVFKTAAQSMAEDVVDRTPVDTGFLRASLSASLVEPIQINRDATPPKGAGKGSFPAPANVSLVINNMKLGDKLHIGFVAAYAMRIEYGFKGEDSLGRSYDQKGAGMVRLASQNWPKHVANAVRQAKAAVASRSRQSPTPAA